MTDVRQQAPQQDPYILALQRFRNFIQEALNIIGQPDTYQAHQAIVNLEQAADWGQKSFIVKIQAENAAKAELEKQAKAAEAAQSVATPPATAPAAPAAT